jgi:hypothetical protein
MAYAPVLEPDIGTASGIMLERSNEVDICTENSYQSVKLARPMRRLRLV